MPCMGPAYQVAKERGEEIFEDVLQLLKDKYHITPPVEITTVGDGTSNMEFLLKNVHRKHLEDWEVATEEMKKAIIELVWEHECSNF